MMVSVPTCRGFTKYLGKNMVKSLYMIVQFLIGDENIVGKGEIADHDQ